jgi:hypothetical protein
MTETKPTKSTIPTEADITAAIAQLRRSERGTRALRHLRTGLRKHGMSGLDQDNWQALITLHRIGLHYSGGTLLSLLETLRLR